MHAGLAGLLLSLPLWIKLDEVNLESWKKANYTKLEHTHRNLNFRPYGYQSRISVTGPQESPILRFRMIDY